MVFSESLGAKAAASAAESRFPLHNLDKSLAKT